MSPSRKRKWQRAGTEQEQKQSSLRNGSSCETPLALRRPSLQRWPCGASWLWWLSVRNPFRQQRRQLVPGALRKRCGGRTINECRRECVSVDGKSRKRPRSEPVCNSVRKVAAEPGGLKQALEVPAQLLAALERAASARSSRRSAFACLRAGGVLPRLAHSQALLARLDAGAVDLQVVLERVVGVVPAAERHQRVGRAQVGLAVAGSSARRG